jgi:hypothetical protein
MAESIRTLQPAEVIGGCTLWKTIRIARGDVESVEHPQSILEIAHLGSEGCHRLRGEVTQGAPQTMSPALLAVVKMQCLEGLLHRLMASKASPLMVASIGTELSLGEVSSGLMQPVSCTIHGVILGSCPQSLSPYS